MIEVCIIILANILLYFKTISFDYVIDDLRNKQFMDEPYRDMYNQWGLKLLVRRLYGCGFFKDKRADHALTIFLHTTICLLIYFTFGANQVSFIASLLYATNPANNQTSIWCNGRRYAINIIFVLTMYLLRPYGYILYPLTSLFQVNAILSPLLLPIKQYWFMFFLCPLFFLFWRGRMIQWFKGRYGGLIKDIGTNFDENHAIKPRKLILVIKTLGYYAAHCLFPVKVCFYSDFLQTFGVTKSGKKDAYKLNYQFWLGILWVFFSIWSILIIGSPIYTFGLFWFHLFILQWCNFITITQTVADRYTSLPNVGLMLALAYLISSHPVIIAVFLTYYALKTISLFPMYKSIDNFYIYHVYNYPNSIMGILHYEKVTVEHNMLFHAFVASMRGLQYNPTDYRLLYQHILILNQLGFKDDARERIKQAKEVIGDQVFCKQTQIEQAFVRLKMEVG